MYIRTKKVNGKTYYQLVLDNHKVIQLGTPEKILKMYEEYQKRVSELGELNKTSSSVTPYEKKP